jgi:hypothetical protein
VARNAAGPWFRGQIPAREAPVFEVTGAYSPLGDGLTDADADAAADADADGEVDADAEDDGSADAGADADAEGSTEPDAGTDGSGTGVGSGKRRDGMPRKARTKISRKMPMTARTQGRASRSSRVGSDPR